MMVEFETKRGDGSHEYGQFMMAVGKERATPRTDDPRFGSRRDPLLAPSAWVRHPEIAKFDGFTSADGRGATTVVEMSQLTFWHGEAWHGTGTALH